MKASLPIAVLRSDPGPLARGVEHTATRAEIPPVGELYDADRGIDEVVLQDGIDFLDHGDYSVGKYHIGGFGRY